MLDIKVLLTKILKKLKPTTIYNTKLTAPSTQSQYAYASVPNLANYNIVLIRCECYYARQLLIFCRLFGDTPMYMTDMSGSTYIRGGYLVDWSSNKIGVRWLEGTAALASYIYTQQVYGIL